MKWFNDIHGRRIRLTEERQLHIEADHPEMSGQITMIETALLNPDMVVRSKTDPQVELFYRYCKIAPVPEKYLCLVVKIVPDDLFIITAYFTDTMKGGEILWEKK